MYIDTETIIKMSAIYWAFTNLGSMLFMLLLWRTQRHYVWLLYAICCLLKAAWGFTIPGINIEVVKVINSIVLPIVAGTLFFFATYTLINVKAKKPKDEL